MQENSNTYHFYGPEDIKRYLNGGMNAQEMHDMEKAALKDPLLADAIDGFRNADASVTHKHLNDIRAAILGTAEKENIVVSMPQRTPVKWWRWAAAACILAVIAGGTWKLMQEKTMLPAAPIAGTIQEPVKDTHPASSEEHTVQLSQAPADNMLKKTPVATAKNRKAAGIAVQAKTNKEMQNKELSDGWLGPIGLTPNMPMAAEARPAIASASYNNPIASEKTGDEIKNNGALSETASAGTVSLLQRSQDKNSSSAIHQASYITGKVTDKQGNPLPSATVSAAENKRMLRMLTKNDGSFALPARDSSLKVSVGMVGYNNAVATLARGRQNNIVLSEAENNLNEIVVVGYGRQKKKGVTGSVGDYRDFQKQTEKAWKNEVMYPEEGWAHFYEELGTGLGVDQARATKTLQIKFTVDDNGDPVDFEIVESPDELLTKKTIEMIRKTKWKNFKLDKNAVVKIEVN